MSYYQEPGSHVGVKVKVVLNFSSFSTKTELIDATGADTFNLAAKTDFIALKVNVDKLEIYKLINASIALSTSKTKLDDLDVDKLKLFL